MSNYMEEAFAPAAAKYKAQVMASTWGHLAPEPRRIYTGIIVFTHGTFGDIVAITVEFDGLDDSPWFFEDLLEFIGRKCVERGTVHRFIGTYTRFKNGGHRFSGKTTQLQLGDIG